MSRNPSTSADHQARDLFTAALACQSASDRRKFLDAACKSDPELRARVESLLEEATRIGDFLMELKMEKEAMQWWRSRMDVNPDHHECVGCAQRVASKMEPNQAREFLRQRFRQTTAQHGPYASAIAAIFDDSQMPFHGTSMIATSMLCLAK